MIKVEQATSEHINQLIVLFDAYRVWYRMPSDTQGAKSFLSDRLTKIDSIIYVAWDGNLAVGFTQLYPSFSSTRMKRMWILNDLFVEPTHRGRGISKLLIEEAKSLCNKTNGCGILLETEKSNTIGNKLYPAQGFHLEENNFYFWKNVTNE